MPDNLDSLYKKYNIIGVLFSDETAKDIAEIVRSVMRKIKHRGYDTVAIMKRFKGKNHDMYVFISEEMDLHRLGDNDLQVIYDAHFED